MNRGLRDSVHIDRLRPFVAMPRNPSLETLKLQSLASEDHRPQVRLSDHSDRFIGCGEMPECGRSLTQNRHAFLIDQIAKFFRRTGHQVWRYHQPSAIDQ